MAHWAIPSAIGTLNDIKAKLDLVIKIGEQFPRNTLVFVNATSDMLLDMANIVYHDKHWDFYLAISPENSNKEGILSANDLVNQDTI